MLRPLRNQLRVLLALVVVSLGLVLTAPSPAFACKCTSQVGQEQVDSASVVFVGTVDQVSEDGRRRFVYDLTATHAYKGEVERETSVASRQETTACGLGALRVGRDYVFVATGTAAPYRANTCSGSGPANTKRLTAVEAVAGAGTPIEPPPPPTAVLTRVEADPPLGFAQAAAPGAAAVLVGLLGLLVVRRLSRRG